MYTRFLAIMLGNRSTTEATIRKLFGTEECKHEMAGICDGNDITWELIEDQLSTTKTRVHYLKYSQTYDRRQRLRPKACAGGP